MVYCTCVCVCVFVGVPLCVRSVYPCVMFVCCYLVCVPGSSTYIS